MLTTEPVLWEVLNSFASHSTRSASHFRVQEYLRDRRSKVIGFDPVLNSAALHLYETHYDKDWGIVDCLSFEVMRKHGIHDALTTDHHFVQAGFTALLPTRFPRHRPQLLSPALHTPPARTSTARYGANRAKPSTPREMPNGRNRTALIAA